VGKIQKHVLRAEHLAALAALGGRQGELTS